MKTHKIRVIYDPTSDDVWDDDLNQRCCDDNDERLVPFEDFLEREPRGMLHSLDKNSVSITELPCDSYSVPVVLLDGYCPEWMIDLMKQYERFGLLNEVMFCGEIICLEEIEIPDCGIKLAKEMLADRKLKLTID